jgi:hypothetical protein
MLRPTKQVGSEITSAVRPDTCSPESNNLHRVLTAVCVRQQGNHALLVPPLPRLNFGDLRSKHDVVDRKSPLASNGNRL